MAGQARLKADIAQRQQTKEEQAKARIGEIMLVTTASGERRCLGYAAFVARRSNPAFSKWFTRLQRDIEALGAEPEARPPRIVDLQHALIDLLDELDPDCERFPAKRRAKIAA